MEDRTRNTRESMGEKRIGDIKYHCLMLRLAVEMCLCRNKSLLFLATQNNATLFSYGVFCYGGTHSRDLQQGKDLYTPRQVV